MLRSIPEFTSLYPAVALTLIALHLWAASGVSPFAAVRGLAVVFLVALVLAAIAGILMRDIDRGALVGLLLIMAVAAGGRQPVPLLAVLGGVLIAVVRFGPWQPTIHWPWASLQLRRATSILALAVLLEAIQLGRIWDLVTSVQRETSFRANPTVDAHEDATEVYVILLDGYARHDILGARFGLDDSPFLDGLRTRGSRSPPRIIRTTSRPFLASARS